MAKSLANSFEDFVTPESGEWDESNEKSKGHTKNPATLGESISEKLEENMVGIAIGCSDRVKESDSEVFKISCTTRKNLITDTYIDDTWESHQALPLEGSREAYNPHQAVYLIVVV